MKLELEVPVPLRTQERILIVLSLNLDLRPFRSKNHYEKFINMNLKDIVIFSENIIHKTNKNISNQVRFAGIVRLKKKD